MRMGHRSHAVGRDSGQAEKKHIRPRAIFINRLEVAVGAPTHIALAEQAHPGYSQRQEDEEDERPA